MSHHLHDWKAIFLAALREIPVVSHAARAAGVSYRHVYHAREDDSEFARLWEEALEEGIDRAEQEAFRRAVVGFEEPVIDKGRLAYRYERWIDPETQEERYRPVLDEQGQPVPLTVRKHSDALLALYLRGRRKRVYAERTELTGADGGPVATQVDETAKATRVAQLMARAARRKAEADEFGDLA